MLYALDDSNHRVQPVPGGHAVCPACSQPVIAKCGEIYIWHWAHKSGRDCDSWAEPESGWHISWKERFELREVVFEKDGVKHRADVVLPNGAVLELQHSSISVQEIREREQFYERMAWVFDITGQTDPKQYWLYYGARFEIRQADGYWTFKWRNARQSIAMARKPVFLDLGNDQIFFIKHMYASNGRGHLWTYDQFVKALLVTQYPSGKKS